MGDINIDININIYSKVREPYSTTGLGLRRPEDPKANAYLRMYEWLEDSEDGIYTLGELQQYLKEISEGEDNPYWTRWIKSKHLYTVYATFSTCFEVRLDCHFLLYQS